ETTSFFDKEKLQERIAKLAGGVAVISVGAATATEIKERKLRIEDALNASREAVEVSIIPGVSTAYIIILEKVAEMDAVCDERTGINIILLALEEPVRQIAKKAGVDGGVINERLINIEKVIGFNALTGELGDMIDAGIIDPTKVT